MKRPTRRTTLAVASLVVLAGAVWYGTVKTARAQNLARPKGVATIHFNTKLGSFKLLNVDREMVTGKLVMKFHGGLLLSGIEKPPKLDGKFRLEYSYLPLKKYAYSGDGTITVEGPLRGVQWFGSDLTATFTGRGKIRIVGEFDKNLNTGEYWYGNPKDKKPWPANNIQELLVPPYDMTGASIVPQERDETKSSGK